jgi:hypothetical protein
MTFLAAVLSLVHALYNVHWGIIEKERRECSVSMQSTSRHLITLFQARPGFFYVHHSGPFHRRYHSTWHPRYLGPQLIGSGWRKLYHNTVSWISL